MRLLNRRRRKKTQKDKLQVKKKIENFRMSGDDIEQSIDYVFKIVLFGDSKEKLKLVDRFFTNVFESDIKLSIGVDFEVKLVEVGDIKVKFQIWDFSSDRRFQFLIPMYVRGASGGFFVYDMNSKGTTETMEEWLDLIKKKIHKQDDFPLVAIGITPVDEDEMQVSIEEGFQMAKEHGLDGFIECKIRSSEDINQAFTRLVQLILKKKPPLSSLSLK